MLIRIPTRQWAKFRIGVHCGRPSKDKYSDSGDEDSLQHMLFDFPELKEQSLKCLGSRFFADLNSLPYVSLWGLVVFLRMSG